MNRPRYCPDCSGHLVYELNLGKCEFGCGKVWDVGEKENVGENESLRIALVACKACGKDISSEAEACIHCGQPMSTGIKCPTCKASKVQKISAASKVGSAVLVGIFSVGKLTKTYQCKACGYRW